MDGDSYSLYLGGLATDLYFPKHSGSLSTRDEKYVSVERLFPSPTRQLHDKKIK
jgi:hypothetical protein